MQAGNHRHRKIEKYREVIDNRYIFQTVALEVQGFLGESSEVFITRLCKMLCRSYNDQRAGSFLKQRISMALQICNAPCVLGTLEVEVEVVNDAFLTLKAFRIGMSLFVLGKCHMKGSIQDHMVVSSTIQQLIPGSIVFHRYCW